MKKQMSLFVWAAAAFGISAVLSVPDAGATTVVRNNITIGGGGYGAYVAPPPQGDINVNVNKYEPAPQGGVYRASSADYDSYKGCTPTGCGQAAPPPVVTQAPPPAYTPPPKQEKKPAPKQRAASGKEYLASPFFQPKQGHVGSVTDVGWARNSYDFSIHDINPIIDPLLGAGFYEGVSGNWKGDELFIKEDLSFGITDTVAVIGSIRYGWSDYRMNWTDPTTPNDRNKSDGFDQYGIGLQWKFMDSDEWVAYIAGYYQWNDIANSILADLKVGYKIGNSVVYGLGRVWSIGWDANSYGNGIVADTGQVTYFAFKRDVERSLFAEGGLGLFSALSDDWSTNLELIIGDYEWHSQANLGASLWYQPTNHFALGVYGRASIWDSADSSDKVQAWGWWPAAGITVPVDIGRVDLKNYSDIAFGVKGILYF